MSMSFPDRKDEVQWVQPPPPPVGLSILPLSRMNQHFLSCDQVFILPGPIDIARLKNAISSWLTLVPHAAGRLSRGKDPSWAIKLSYPIPITLSTYTGTYTDEQVYTAFPPFVDPLPWVYEPPQDSENHPLTRFKITTISRTKETAVAIHICHAVVDGISLFRVLNILSDLYCGSSASDHVPVDLQSYFTSPPPYLDPQGEAYSRALAKMPVLMKTYEPEAHLNKVLKSIEGTDRVDLFFTKEQMKMLSRRVNASVRAKGSHITTGNVLPAYLFTVLNRVYGQPKFDRVLSVLGIRGRSAPQGSSYVFPSTTSAGMAMVQTVSERFPKEQLLDVSALAASLRDHNEGLLKPETLLDIVSVYEQRMTELSKEGRLPYILPDDDGILGVNLMHRTEVRVHFGYGVHRCRFFNWYALKHYIRAFKANPIRRGDGTWESREGVIYVSFLVEEGFGIKVRDLIREELDAWTLEDEGRRVPHSKL